MDSQRRSSPVQHVDVCVILPAFCGFMFSGELLKQLGAFRASCRNPKNRIATRSNAWIWRARFWSRLPIKIEIENSLEMALSKAKSGSAWQSHFWQCGTLRPARNTKLLHYASKSKLGFVQAASFNATGEDHFFGVQKANVFTAPKMRLLQ